MFVPTPLQTKLFPCDNKYNQREIYDLEKSWAHVIKDKVLPYFAVLEFEFARFFHKTMGRPIKYISLLIVVHIFKEMYDWSDEELLANIRFDKRFEYAFELPYHELTVCQKTLHNFRMLIQSHEMGHTIFDRGTKHIARIFNIDTSKQRLDSTHIISNMARLSRLALFVRVIENFLFKLKKLDTQAYDSLPKRFLQRYGKRRGYFADARSQKSKHRLGEAANDMYYLIDRFSAHGLLSSLKVTAQLKRVFHEQCSIRQVEETSEDVVEVLENDLIASGTSSIPPSRHDNQTTQQTKPVVEQISQAVVKQANELPSGTLQNPSDEDVTCGYKGPGYEATFTETCCKENPFQVITDVQVDPSDHSDQHKTLDVVDRLSTKQMKPEQLHTDGGFTSGENIADCADKGVNLQGNLVGVDKEPDKLKLVDFEFARDQITLLSCPAGKKPVAQKREKSRKSKSKSQRSFLVYFDLAQCQRCALVTDCPVKLQKKQAVVRFSRAQLISSKRRREQQTDIFKEQNKIRAGIESTNAEMKKSQGLAKLRVRGQPRVTQTVCFKALACNIKRMVKYVQSRPKIDLKFENEPTFATI